MATVLLAEDLIDFTGRDPSCNAAVIVENGRIARVAPQLDVSPGPDDQVTEATDATLMPGMRHMQCHISYVMGKSLKEYQRDPDELVRLIVDAMDSLRQWLMDGVTTIRELGTELNFDLRFRDAIASGKFIGPRMISSGLALAMTGGIRHSRESGIIKVDGPNEARRAARHQLRVGVELIKMFASAGGGEGRFIPDSGWPQMNLEKMQPAVFEAHKTNRTATAHAIGTQASKNALHAGVNSVEHCTFLRDKALALLKERDAVMMPTLAVGERLVAQGTELRHEPHIGERARIAAEQDRISVQMAGKAGIRIVTGTDSVPVYKPMMMRECDCLHRARLALM